MKRLVVPRKRATDAHDGKHQHGPDHCFHASETLRKPAKKQRAKQLAEITDRYHEADLRAVSFHKGTSTGNTNAIAKASKASKNVATPIITRALTCQTKSEVVQSAKRSHRLWNYRYLNGLRCLRP